MKRTCVQCGKEFELTNGEIGFYKSRNMNLPKRCKACRAENKQKKTGAAATAEAAANAAFPAPQSGPHGKSGGGIKRILYAVFALAALAVGLVFSLNHNNEPAPGSGTTSAPVQTTAAKEEDAQTPETAPEATGNAAPALRFRSRELLQSHFEKHGAQMRCATAEDYLAAANAVVANPDALQKTETDDGDNDRVYFLEATEEIVFVSEDGYIKTYFSADRTYFDKQ